MQSNEGQGTHREAAPEEPRESGETWVRAHLFEVIVAILLGLVAYFGNHTLSSIEGRLGEVEKNTGTVDKTFNGFKQSAENTHTNLQKAIELTSEQFDKKTQRTIKLILQVRQEQEKLQSSIKSTGEVVYQARRELNDIKSEIAQIARSEQIVALQGRASSVDAQLTSVETKLETLAGRTDSAERQRILLEAKQRLSQFDEEYLFSRAHETKTFRMGFGSGFVGQTVEIRTPQAEYQVSRTVKIDFENGTLRLWGKVKNRETKNALERLLESIPGVKEVNAEELEVE